MGLAEKEARDGSRSWEASVFRSWDSPLEEKAQDSTGGMAGGPDGPSHGLRGLGPSVSQAVLEE